MKSLFLAALVSMVSYEVSAIGLNQKTLAPIPINNKSTVTASTKVVAPAALAAPKNLQKVSTTAPVKTTTNVAVGEPAELVMNTEKIESPFAKTPDAPLENAYFSSLKIGKLSGLKY